MRSAKFSHLCLFQTVTCHLKMTKFIQLTAVFLILISCNKSNEIEGVWYASYSIMNGQPERLHETTLFDFEGEQLYTVTIRDLASGKNERIIIDTTTYSLSDYNLKLFKENLTFHLSGDSIVLNLEDPKQKLVLRRLPSTIKNPKIISNCFQGAYLIKSQNYRDSVYFINDSLLIYTGEYDQNYPASKWQIIDYKGYKFLNEHNENRPVTLIKACNEQGIKLQYPSIKIHEIEMIPQEKKSSRTAFIGTWCEVDYTNPNIPPPPSLNQVDLPFKAHFSTDSVTVRKHGRTEILRWDLTSDGKRIYFIDKLQDIDGSWKVLTINDSILTLRVANYLKPEIVELKKIKTAGNKK